MYMTEKKERNHGNFFSFLEKRENFWLKKKSCHSWQPCLSKGDVKRFTIPGIDEAGGPMNAARRLGAPSVGAAAAGGGSAGTPMGARVSST